MAYGVKYRLDFSDVRSRKRRVEILKKDYGGAVLPMIGTDEPVIIEWKADDDFYEPLIGSQCQLNLWVTDDVTYDQFYLFNEQEYSVKVYYESAPNVYTLYWNGWIANDIYSEAITSTPYKLTVNANDGLGSLEAFDSWFPAVGEADPKLWKFIHKNLEKIGLGFEIWISNDIRISNESIWNNVFDDVSIYKEGVFENNYIIQNAKKVLRSILIAFNCKIYQAYGRWIIANASSYGDQRVITGIQNGSLSGAGILAAKQGYLNSGSEDIKFEIYNAAGANTGGITDNYIRIVPQFFKAINNNLTRLIKRPLRRYQEILNIKQKKIDSNYNASFEFDLENFGVVGGYTISDQSFAGRKAFRFTDYVTGGTPVYDTKIFSVGALNAIQGDQYQLLISVNISKGGSDNRIPYYIRIFLDGLYYYVGSDGNWANSPVIVWNEFKVIGDGTFESFRVTTKAAPNNGQLEIAIGAPYLFDPFNYTATFIDNFAIRNINSEINRYNEIYAIREQLGTFIASDVLEHDNIYVANVGEIVFWGAFIGLPAFRRAQDNTGRFLEEIVTQQRLNDFREYCKTYEGDLSSASQYLVLSMMNKVYFKFNTFAETDSAIMDNMKFMVKSDVYSINCHVPNNYTDVASTYRLSYQE
jgi:hypothetical protein